MYSGLSVELKTIFSLFRFLGLLFTVSYSPLVTHNYLQHSFQYFKPKARLLEMADKNLLAKAEQFSRLFTQEDKTV